MKRYGPKTFSLLLFFLFSCAAAPCPALAGKANTKIIPVFPDTGEMVPIPEGEFIMGATEKDGLVGIEVDVAAMPARKVYLKSFYIDRYEVTVARYRRFMEAKSSAELIPVGLSICVKTACLLASRILNSAWKNDISGSVVPDAPISLWFTSIIERTCSFPSVALNVT